MLMYSCGGDLGVGAALGDQGDQFPFPGAELPGVVAAAGTVPGWLAQGILGRGGQAHRRATVLRGPGQLRTERQTGGAQGFGAAPHRGRDPQATRNRYGNDAPLG